jgi:hypothetical protein
MQKISQYGLSVKQRESAIYLLPEEYRTEFSQYLEQAGAGKTTQVVKTLIVQGKSIEVQIEFKPLLKEGQQYSCIGISVHEKTDSYTTTTEHIQPRFNIQAVEEARSLIAGVAGMAKVVASASIEGYQRDMLTMIVKNSEKATLFLSAALDADRP